MQSKQKINNAQTLLLVNLRALFSEISKRSIARSSYGWNPPTSSIKSRTKVFLLEDYWLQLKSHLTNEKFKSIHTDFLAGEAFWILRVGRPLFPFNPTGRPSGYAFLPGILWQNWANCVGENMHSTQTFYFFFVNKKGSSIFLQWKNNWYPAITSMYFATNFIPLQCLVVYCRHYYKFYISQILVEWNE